MKTRALRPGVCPSKKPRKCYWRYLPYCTPTNGLLYSYRHFLAHIQHFAKIAPFYIIFWFFSRSLTFAGTIFNWHEWSSWTPVEHQNLNQRAIEKRPFCFVFYVQLGFQQTPTQIKAKKNRNKYKSTCFFFNFFSCWYLCSPRAEINAKNKTKRVFNCSLGSFPVFSSITHVC